MENVASINDARCAIATIVHNLRCIEEAEKITKEDFKEEKIRLTKLLQKYKKEI